jgi:hypothetical protein
MEGVVCGPDGKYNTRPEERVDIPDYLNCIQMFMRVIVDYCGGEQQKIDRSLLCIEHFGGARLHGSRQLSAEFTLTGPATSGSFQAVFEEILPTAVSGLSDSGSQWCSGYSSPLPHRWTPTIFDSGADLLLNFHWD